jgi:Homeodomain-like domain
MARTRGALERTQLELLVAQNLTVREIADAVGRSFTTVRYWLRQYGLATTREARTKRARGTEAQPRFEDYCPKHGRTVFARRKTGHAQCLRCRADAVSEWRRRAKSLLIAEAGGACRLCGFDAYAGALHFHHLDPAESASASVAAGWPARLKRFARRRASACSCARTAMPRSRPGS